MNDNQRRLLRGAQRALEDMPVGGIGAGGASQYQLDAIADRGGVYYRDANYHQAQQAWLLIERAIEDE